MTRPGPHESIAPALGRFGRLSMAIVAAILAGPPAWSSGCARCGAPSPELNRAPSVQSASPGQQKRLASREARPRRLKGELKIAAVGGSYHVCVRACDGGFFLSHTSATAFADRDLPGVVSERRDATLFHAVRRHDRGLRFGVRPAVREPPQRRQIRASCGSELLLPAQGSELGGGARRRWGEASAPRGRYPGHAGNLRAEVAAGGGAAADQHREGPCDRCGRPGAGPETRATAGGSRRQRRGLGLECGHRGSLSRNVRHWRRRDGGAPSASVRARSWSRRVPTARSSACGSSRQHSTDITPIAQATAAKIIRERDERTDRS